MTEAAQSDALGWSKFDLAPARSFRVFGMRRAGNHAVINWMQRNTVGSGAIFVNNCKYGQHPFKSPGSVEVNGTRVPNKPEKLTKAGGSPMVILSYEDTMPRDNKPATEGLRADEIDVELLIHRSFSNWMASLLTKLRQNDLFTAAQRMTILLRALGSYADGLAMVQSGGLLGVSYDAWVSDEAYRTSLIATLGLTATDNTLGAVQPYGQGSSFQTDATEGTALATRDRSAALREDPEFYMILWIAAQEGDFIRLLSVFYPEEAAKLRQITSAPPRFPHMTGDPL
jgi:hypothetical protein